MSTCDLSYHLLVNKRFLQEFNHISTSVLILSSFTSTYKEITQDDIVNRLSDMTERIQERGQEFKQEFIQEGFNRFIGHIA